MGFDRELCIEALTATDNDFDGALELLLNGFKGGDQYESDLRSPMLLGSNIEAQTNADGNYEDENQEFVVDDAALEALIDSRVNALKDMGFTTAQAEVALDRCNNDINEALSYLLESK